MKFLKGLLIVLAIFSQSAFATFHFKILELVRAGHKELRGAKTVGYVDVHNEGNELSAYLHVNGIDIPLTITITWANYRYQFFVNSGEVKRNINHSPAPAKETDLIKTISEASPNGLTNSIILSTTESWSVDLDEHYIMGLQDPKKKVAYTYGNVRLKYPLRHNLVPNDVNLQARRLFLLPTTYIPITPSKTFDTYTDADVSVTFELLTTLALLFNVDAYPPSYESIPRYSTSNEASISVMQHDVDSLTIRSASPTPDTTIEKSQRECPTSTAIHATVEIHIAGGLNIENPPTQCKDGKFSSYDRFPDLDPPSGGAGSSVF